MRKYVTTGRPKWADWHRWFAWYPVWVIKELRQLPDGYLFTRKVRYWLEWVERKGTAYSAYDTTVFEWEYREPRKEKGKCDTNR